MKNIDTLIFDLDGTLVDSMPAMRQAIIYTMGKMNIPESSLGEVITSAPKGLVDLWRRLLKSEDETLVNQALDIYKTVFSNRYFQEIKAYPGVIETVTHFHDKGKVVVTNGLADLSWKILEHVKLDGFIDKLIGGDDIGCVKPMACPLDKGIDKFDADKQSVLMVGDMVVDVAAGKAAGVYTCAVTYGFGKFQELEAACPDYIISDIRELIEIFGP